MLIKANNPNLSSWVDVPTNSDFPIQNLPFGIFKTKGLRPRVCTAIGNYVADLMVIAEHGFFDDLDFDIEVFAQPYLNAFIALGRETTRAVRNRISEILDNDLEDWDASELAAFFLHEQSEVEMMMPIRIGDYTDFYSNLEHASNAGKMFVDPNNPLPSNWKHLPIGYHGRASSIRISGSPVHRPKGQQKPNNADSPVFGPSQWLDFELETAFVVGKSTQPGESISMENAEDYIFGMVLFNDWSARDIQKWEMTPLGPFLSKSFASTISPWVITMDALDAFRTIGPVQNPKPLPYLEFEGMKNYDINLKVQLQPKNGEATTISRTNFKYMYWNMCQQLVHHSVNGCNFNVGDLCGSGTISGPTPDSLGCLLELTWGGTKPLKLADGSERVFLEDGDTVTLKGYAERDGVRIGFGEAKGTIV